MKRSKHSLSHYRLLTTDMGKLTPIACYEVLPGDSIQQSTSALIRVSPLLAPVMHPVQVRIHHWFVPNRIIWDQWEDFITGAAAVSPPQQGPVAIGSGKIEDYFGLPIGAGMTYSLLPNRAYNLVWSEFYRDQDLSAEPNLDGSEVREISWEKDYFTTARPWPQKGPDVTLPLGVKAPVKGIGTEGNVYDPTDVQVYESGGGRPVYGDKQFFNVTAGARQMIKMDPANPGFPDIYADLTNATATNINDVRRAFALQRYQEARAQYGSRYTEYLRYLGVRSSDARLQRPEYLGGGKATISFSEVLQTGPGSDPDESVVGDLKGHGISALRTRRYRRFFEEHGIVLSLLSVRPRTMYTQGVDKMFARRTKEEYWQKELELIGQEEIYNSEVYTANEAADREIFGYNDRYASYRHIQSKVCGEFRNLLDFWHMGRVFGARPVLNESFIKCDPTKRIHAVQTNHTLWCMVNHSIQARRLVGKNTIGRVI